jgi:hypothetical protein
MTPEQKRAVAEALADGLSERDTAKRAGVSPTAVHRLRQRLPVPAPGDQATPDIQVAPEPQPAAEPVSAPGEHDAEITALLEAREAIAAALLVQEDRADASRQALAGLDAERLAMLESGRDAAVLRPRTRDAEDDLKDWQTAADLLAGRLAEVNGAITRLSAERDLAAGQAALAAELAAGEQLAAAAPAVLREAVQAIRAASASVVGYRVSVAAAQARIGGRHQAVSAALETLGQPRGPVPVLGQAAPLPAVPRNEAVGALGRGWELAGTAAAGDGLGTHAAERLTAELAAAAAGDVYGRAAAWEASAAERQAQAQAGAEWRAKQAAELQAVRERGLSGGAQPWSTDLDGNGNPTWRDPRQRLADRSDAYPGTPPERAYGPGGRPW